MRMEIEELILYLTATKSGIEPYCMYQCTIDPIIDLEDQDAALAENKREIEYLQEQLSLTSIQLLSHKYKS